jgi:hypothetical protein
VLLLATVAFVPGTLLAQLSTGAIEGTLRAMDGHALAGTAILINGGAGFRTVIISNASGLAMSLETPIKIRMLQRKLYQKAKGEPNYRFYLLYNKMYREDILAHAYTLVKSNQGAPGVDGQTFWGIETLGLEEWLNGIRMDLRGKTYQPQAVRRVMIPKPGGGQGPLGFGTRENLPACAFQN